MTAEIKGYSIVSTNAISNITSGKIFVIVQKKFWFGVLRDITNMELEDTKSPTEQIQVIIQQEL